MTIAIDFGTSNTVVARWNTIEQKSEIIELKNISQLIGNNDYLIPSLIYVENGINDQVIIGKKVEKKGLDINNNSRFFRCFKRGIGAENQGFLPQLDGQDITFEKVGELFLNALIRELGEIPDSLILTVPVDSFENYRTWLIKICESWQINQIRMIDESTAAALGYQTDIDNLILVIDFGGGTIDFSLVKLNLEKNQKPTGFILKWGQNLLGNNSAQKTKIANVIAKIGKNLGGADLDNWLMDYFQKTQNIPKSSLTFRLIEKIKIALSNNLKTEEIYFNDLTLDTYQLSLDRVQFDRILEDNNFFSDLDNLMTNLLQQARRNGVEIGDIDTVLLVGGTTQIPAFKTWITNYFDETKIKGDRPFSAIATGALQLEKGIEIKDFLYHSYGIRYWDKRQKCHNWHPIISSGQPYPMVKPIELYLGASVENQPSIELIMGELGVENSNTEVFFDGDRLITRTTTNREKNVKILNKEKNAYTIAKLNPLGNPGSDRIKVEFWIDEQRFLKIKVEDLLTNEILIDNQSVVKLS